MNHPASRPASPWMSKESLLALLLGGVLGQMVMVMAEKRPDDMFSFAMAVVCVLAGSASLVMAMLHAPATTPVKARAAQVPVWLLAIGAGLLLTLRFGPF